MVRSAMGAPSLRSGPRDPAPPGRRPGRLDRGLRVLDVGGGDGRDALALAEAGHHVTIVDPAPAWLAQATRSAEHSGLTDRVSTVLGSLDDLPLGTGDYDLVLCHFVLHYRPAGGEDIGRLSAMLRPGGRLSVMAPNPAARVIMRLTREGPDAALAESPRTRSTRRRSPPPPAR